MTIKTVYLRFGIPPNLQEHMLRVAGVVDFIAKNWQGPLIDWEMLRKIALLHDLGNVVKFDFEKYPEFLGSERES